MAHDTKPAPTQELTDAQEEQARWLFDRLITIRDARDADHDEFDGRGLEKWVEDNAKTANSFVAPREHESDVNIVTGTAREKMLSILSHFLSLNLAPEVSSYVKGLMEDIQTGRIFTDLVRKSNDVEEDEIKQVLRWMYLMEQGTVLIEEAWLPLTQTEKKFKKDSKLDPSEGFSKAAWTERQVTEYHAEKRLIDLLSFYPGNVKQFDLEKQPDYFIREVMHIDEAEAIYGKWAAWKYVVGGGNAFTTEQSVDSVPYRNYRLYGLEEEQVEVVRYFNKWRDEFQIIINGVLMLPAGFPMPHNYSKKGSVGKSYNLTKVVYEPISAFFFYGKSLMAKLTTDQALLDEMIRLLVRKFRQSVEPPVANNTGQVLNKHIFDAGTMWYDVDPSKLEKLIDHNGVTSSEYQMYQLMQQNIDAKSVTPIFQGQREQGDQTATEVLQREKRAEQSLGLALLSIRLLEQGVNWLRLQTVLDHWLEPMDSRIDKARNVVVNKYRSVDVENANIDGKTGVHRIEFTDFVPTNKVGKDGQVLETDQQFKRRASFALMGEEDNRPSPAKRTIFSITLFKRMKYDWKLTVTPVERDNSNIRRLMFGEQTNQLLTLFQPQEINRDSLKKRFAQVWGEDPEELFVNQGLDQLAAMLNQGSGEAPAVSLAGMSGMMPKEQVRKPTPASVIRDNQ